MYFFAEDGTHNLNQIPSRVLISSPFFTPQFCDIKKLENNFPKKRKEKLFKFNF
jgi:hypothetical protein